MKSYISSVFQKKTFFELNNFRLVSEQRYPKNQTICIYIWKDKNEQLFWQTGIYNQKLKQFSVCYGTTVYAINEDKVIAWKKMNADAVVLEIIDRRNQKQWSKAKDKMGKEQIFLQGRWLCRMIRMFYRKYALQGVYLCYTWVGIEGFREDLIDAVKLILSRWERFPVRINKN